MREGGIFVDNERVYLDFKETFEGACEWRGSIFLIMIGRGIVRLLSGRVTRRHAAGWVFCSELR